MKRKKWMYITLLIVLIAPILYFYQAFNGNPISHYFSTKAVKDYLISNYPNNEYNVGDGAYNFKIGGYTYQVVQIGSEHQEEYEFNVTGFFKPTVTYDGIYYANLDEPLMEKLSNEITTELKELFKGKVARIVDGYVQIEVTQGALDPDTEWRLDLPINKPLYISLTLDVTSMSKEEVLEDVIFIQKTLTAENYPYERVTFNGNLFDLTNDKDDMGYVKYAISFDKYSKITLNEIEEFN